MAIVIATPDESVMVLEVQTGLTEAGSPILANRSYPNIKPATLDQDFYDVAVALGALSDDALISVRRDNRIDMTE